MKFRSILIHCPHEGLFCKLVTTFVGYDTDSINEQMKSHVTFEFDQLADFLTTSSAYNEIEHHMAMSDEKGFHALIELAKKWRWNVNIWEGDVK